MKRLSVIAAALALASCAANGGLGIGTGTGGGVGLGAGLSFPVGAKAETKAAPALSKHLKQECGKFAANVHNTSEEAALKMCKMGAREALQPNGDEACKKKLENYAKEQPSQTGQDHDVFAENTAAFAYGCDLGNQAAGVDNLFGDLSSAKFPAKRSNEEADDYE